MIHYGDITKISGYDVPIVDCVVGGSPCQDLSVAGKRAGLDGERSNLFMEQIRITKEMRDKDERCNGRSGINIRPRFFIWENVPGAFSSNKGRDFKTVLEEVAKVVNKDAVIPMPPKDKWTTSGAIVGDGWSIAWRVCDAQFWGVPQRRRRITLIADFGGQCAQEILFERRSLSGDSKESREKGQGVTEDAQGCLGVHDRDGEKRADTMPVVMQPYCKKSRAKTSEDATTWVEGTVANTLNAFDIGEKRCNELVVVKGLDVYNQSLTGDKAKTLNSTSSDADHIPCIVMDRASYNQGENAQYNIGIDENGVAFSHIAKGPGAVCYVDTSHADDVVRTDDVVAPLQARDYKGGKLIAVETKPHYIVRRLTPLECERLQGYPDGWTDIGEYTDSKGKKKKSSDTARYKALGNSIALPPWKWVIKRLCSHYERDATLCSLFDGISGFVLLWTQLNGLGSVKWTSEIEDFPIAVCKRHFGDEKTDEKGDFYEAILGRNKTEDV